MDNSNKVVSRWFACCSEPQGISFIETSNLDGETNLKIRMAHPDTARLEDVSLLAGYHATLTCEPPNRQLYDFNGTLKEANSQWVYDSWQFASNHYHINSYMKVRACPVLAIAACIISVLSDVLYFLFIYFPCIFSYKSEKKNSENFHAVSDYAFTCLGNRESKFYL